MKDNTIYSRADGWELPEYRLISSVNGVYVVLNEDHETLTEYTEKEFFNNFSFTPLVEEDKDDETHPAYQDRLLAAEYFTTIYN